MSIRSAPFFWIVCDYAGCTKRCPGEHDDTVAWSDADGARECVAHDSDWLVDGGRHLCGDHWHWCENEDDEPKYGPAKSCCMFKGVIVVEQAQQTW